jgi:hypothetical protein
MEGKMTKIRTKRMISVILALVLILSFGGCGRVDNTIAEPDEITAEYLYGEYAEQLVRDGAEITLGTVKIDADENGQYSMEVEHMVIVESDLTEEGYYVADSNILTTMPLDPEARITYAGEAGAEPEVITVDELAEIVNAADYNPLEEGNEKLFDVYVMAGSVVMALAKELPLTE